MRRRVLNNALFTLADAGFGICAGMLFFHDQDDPSRVDIAVGTACAGAGALGGLAAIAVLWSLFPKAKVFETLATPVGATPGAFSAGMAIGWAIGSNVIAPATERQETALRRMKLYGCIGATLGLSASVFQLIYDHIRSQKIRLALAAFGVTLGGAFVGAALGYVAGQSEGNDLYERARNGGAQMKVGAGVGAILGWTIGVLGMLLRAPTDADQAARVRLP
jgi:hypothetical protein